jgi:hypothetical protein
MNGKKMLLFIIPFFLCYSCIIKSPRFTEANYTNFKIQSIRLSVMPFMDGGASWDPFDGPDVFYNMESANGSVLYNGASSRFQDVLSSELPLNWTFANAYPITNIETTHFITVYDYDTLDPNDQIGYVGFTMKDYKSGYPKSITKSVNGITITISGEWY